MNTFADFGITGIDPSGGEQRTTCPECSHGRKKPNDRCLAVNATDGVWVCHHCGWTGKLEHEPDWRRQRVSRYTRAPFNSAPEPVRPLKAKDIPTGQTDTEAATKGFAWLEGRGIPRAIAERNGVCVTEHFIPGAGDDGKGKVQTCLAFPFYLNGDVVNVKYRTGDKRFAQTKGGGKILYRIDKAKNHDTIIITEGELDALSWEAATDDAEDFPPALSVPDGAPNADAENVTVKMRFLDNCLPMLEHVRRVVLATDNDPNGRRLAEELARRLGKWRCYVVNYPEGCKDSNDVLREHGAAGILTMFATAQPYPVFGVAEPKDSFAEFDEIYKHGYPELAGCGDPALDEYLRFSPGGLTVVTGIPAHGKTTYMNYILTRHMVRNDWRVGFYTPEYSELPQHLHVLSELLTARQFLPGDRQMDVIERDAAKKFLQDHVRYIHSDDFNLFRIEGVLEAAEYLVRSFGINALVIDPFNKIEQPVKGETEREFIRRVLNTLLSFARRERVHVFVVVHPRKTAPGVDNEGNSIERVPTLTDINGSADWYNMMENGLVVYLNKDPKTGKPQYTEVWIRKVKHQFQGSTGRIFYHLDSVSKRYHRHGETADLYAWIGDDGKPATRASAVDQFTARTGDESGPLTEDPF